MFYQPPRHFRHEVSKLQGQEDFYNLLFNFFYLDVLPVVHYSLKSWCRQSQSDDNFWVFLAGMVRYTPEYFRIALMGLVLGCDRIWKDFSDFFHFFIFFSLIPHYQRMNALPFGALWVKWLMVVTKHVFGALEISIRFWKKSSLFEYGAMYKTL